MFLVMWRLRKWEETHFGTSLTLFWKTPSHHSWEDLDQGLFKAEVKLGKRKPFVCVSSFTPKWHRKNTREHFQIGKTPIQQRQKFHERSGCQTSCLAQVCQRKKVRSWLRNFTTWLTIKHGGLTAERGDLTGSWPYTLNLNGQLSINSEDVLVANMMNHRDVELGIGRVSRDVIGVNPQISRIAQG